MSATHQFCYRGRQSPNMTINSPDTEVPTPAVETHLLGQIDFDTALTLQERLVRRIAARDDGQICLLLCEHPPVVTVGRSGTAGDILLESDMLRRQRIEVRWVKRGGGCLVHAPGQLAVYPIVPLRWHGFSVGEYLDRFQAGLMNTLDELNFPVHARPDRRAIYGRTGRLADFGVAVRDWVTYHGAFINVCPSMGLFRLVQSDRGEHDKASCLMAERRQPARMTTLRAALIRHLADSFGCDRYHLHTGHPLLRRRVGYASA